MSTLYLDLETEWLTHEDPLPKFVVAGYCIDGGGVGFCRDASEMAAIVKRAVTAGHLLVCHRGAFELGTLQLPRGLPFYDTAMAATIVGAAAGDPDVAGHSLKDLAKRAGYVHPGGKGKGGLQGSFKQGVEPSPEQLAYLRADVEATRAVFHWQTRKYGNDIPDLERQTEWSRDVFELGRRGLHIDQDRLRGLIAQSSLEERQLWRALRDCGIIQPRGPKKDPWRKSSVAQNVVQELLAAAGVTEKTAGAEGEESELLVRDRLTLVKTGDPRLKLLADYYGRQKWTSLLEAYEAPGGVVRPRYNSLVATGRMSCSAPNVQQVPKRGGLRECWVPRSGHVFVEADYAMLELYTFADTCARWGIPSRLRDALNEGKDVHTMVAESTGIDRQLAKVFNYGGLGGMGPATMQENIEKQLGRVIPIEQLRADMEGWKQTWPEVEAYWKHNTTHPHPAGFKRDKLGVMRMQYKYKVTSPQSGRQRLAYYCAAQNFGFQGPGGDIIKRAIELTNADGESPVAALHDQLLCEVEDKPAAIHYRSQRLAQLMKQAGEEICPNVRWPEVKVHVFRERWESK